MSLSRDLTANRNITLTSASSAATYDPPIDFVAVRGAGNVVLVDEAGNSVTFNSCVAGDVLTGPFSAFTSTTCAVLWLSDAEPKPAAAGTSLSGLLVNAQTTQAQINVPLSSAILAAGTPMAAWADNAGASAPGITLANSKAYAIRWNNQASQTAVWFGVAMPQDLDDTAPIVLHALASKVGATTGDATTLTVTAFFQTAAALHDADADCGGTSSALVGAATSKTVAELTLSIAAADVPPSPSSLSFTVKPTDGTLGTDDFVLSALWIEFTRKILSA